jgi:hypothetical protein
MAACSGTPTFVGSDTKAPPTTHLRTEIGEAAVLDRSDLGPSATTSPATSVEDAHYPPGVTFADVDGVELFLDATGTRDWHQGVSVEFALSVRNRTKRAIGYQTNKESHFALVDDAGLTLWTDDTCRHKAHGQLRTGFLRLEPGEAVTIADYYPTRPGNNAPGCETRPGPATLLAWLTVCRDLPSDDMCPSGHAERVDARPLDVTIP